MATETVIFTLTLLKHFNKQLKQSFIIIEMGIC